MKFTKHIRGSELIDIDGNSVGKVLDIVVDPKNKFPKAKFIIVELYDTSVVGEIELAEETKKIKIFVPWEQIGSFKDYKEKKIQLKVPHAKIQSKTNLNEKWHIGDHILDQQILNSEGIGLRRVNDVILVEHDGDLVLAGVTVGITGIMDQLGFSWPKEMIKKFILLEEPTQDIIPWHCVAEYRPQKRQIKLKDKNSKDSVETIKINEEDDEAEKIIHKKK